MNASLFLSIRIERIQNSMNGEEMILNIYLFPSFIMSTIKFENSIWNTISHTFLVFWG